MKTKTAGTQSKKKHIDSRVTTLASSPDKWRSATEPNYTTNKNLQYPYSEYPRSFGPQNAPYEFVSTKLSQQSKTQILDFWGEGRIDSAGLVTGFKDAYNVNHQFQLVSNGPDKNHKIPNRIPTTDYNNVSVSKYILDGVFDTITLMGAPITKPTASEMVRIISGDIHSVIVTYGIDENDEHIQNLQNELNLKQKRLVISPLYNLGPQLNEVTLEPKLAFCNVDVILGQLNSFFIARNMSSCATILLSLQKSAEYQTAAHDTIVSFFKQDTVRNSITIFNLGYQLIKTNQGKEIVQTFMNANVAKIVTNNFSQTKVISNIGTASNLCLNAKVTTGSWQWAFFGTQTYIDGHATQKGGDVLKLVPAKTEGQFKIQSSFGVTSYLCTNGAVTSGSWQWAFFGTESYLKSSSYHDGQLFYLQPINGGEKFNIIANFRSESILCPNGAVGVGSWQWSFFGTPEYLNNPTYKSGEAMTLELS